MEGARLDEVPSAGDRHESGPAPPSRNIEDEEEHDPPNLYHKQPDSLYGRL